MKMRMKVMKKDIVIIEFLSKISHDLKRTMKITLGGIIYLGGVKLRKFQMISKEKFNWYLMLRYDESYIPQKQEMIMVK